MLPHITIDHIVAEDDPLIADVLIGERAIAHHMSLTPQAVKRLIRNGEVPASRLGRQDRGDWIVHVFSLDG